MPIKISKELKRKLPPNEQKGLEEYLWVKYKNCHICEIPLNKTTDNIEADHDIPTIEGGQQSRDNLWLAHKKCNAFKKNYPSYFVAPYLKFEAFLESKPVNTRYDGCLEHFNVKLIDIHYESTASRKYTFHLPDQIITCDSFIEDVNGSKLEYVYIELPRNVIHNDNDCQPRAIKIKQIWAIYSDLYLNPLYEAPGCRIEKVKKEYRILMFDGQHKTLACWLHNRKSIVVKLFLNLEKSKANILVNSIQGRIKKLPLTALEQAIKLSDEWKDLFSKYQEEADPDGNEISEAGFISFVPPNERKRATAALKASFIDRLIKNEDLDFKDYVEGLSKINENKPFLVKETTIKTKVFDKLLYNKVLKEKGEEGAALREREQKNIVRLLNNFIQEAFEPSGPTRSDKEILRINRMKYQSSLQCISELLKKAVQHICSADEEERALMDKEISDKNWEKINKAIKRLVDHPIWTTDENDKAWKKIDDLIQKHQSIESAMRQLSLSVGYLVGADELPSDWYK